MAVDEFDTRIPRRTDEADADLVVGTADSPHRRPRESRMSHRPADHQVQIMRALCCTAHADRGSRITARGRPCGNSAVRPDCPARGRSPTSPAAWRSRT